MSLKILMSFALVFTISQSVFAQRHSQEISSDYVAWVDHLEFHSLRFWENVRGELMRQANGNEGIWRQVKTPVKNVFFRAHEYQTLTYQSYYLRDVYNALLSTKGALNHAKNRLSAYYIGSVAEYHLSEVESALSELQSYHRTHRRQPPRRRPRR